MSRFQTALAAWLQNADHTQHALASAIGKNQAAISKYLNGVRFPDSATARAIDAHTGGAVPFEAWQSDFLARAGLGDVA